MKLGPVVRGNWTPTGYFNEPRPGGILHPGLDIGVVQNTPVYAVLGGTVLKTTALNAAGKIDGYGSSTNGGKAYNVEIDHGNGYYTRYAHLNSANVQVGQRVEQGDEIGKSGTTAGGPHLHFELKTFPGYTTTANRAQLMNPLPYLQGTPLPDLVKPGKGDSGNWLGWLAGFGLLGLGGLFLWQSQKD